MGKLRVSVPPVAHARPVDRVKAVAAAADVIHIDVMDAQPVLALGSVVVASPRPHAGSVLRPGDTDRRLDEVAELGPEVGTEEAA